MLIACVGSNAVFGMVAREGRVDVGQSRLDGEIQKRMSRVDGRPGLKLSDVVGDQSRLEGRLPR